MLGKYNRRRRKNVSTSSSPRFYCRDTWLDFQRKEKNSRLKMWPVRVLLSWRVKSVVQRDYWLDHRVMNGNACASARSRKLFQTAKRSEKCRVDCLFSAYLLSVLSSILEARSSEVIRACVANRTYRQGLSPLLSPRSKVCIRSNVILYWE